MSKKLFAVLLVVVSFVFCVGGGASADVIGELMMYDKDFIDEQLTAVLRGGRQVLPLYVVGVDMSKTEMKYYDSLSVMLLALEKGGISR